jgi:hypothetical protein
MSRGWCDRFCCNSHASPLPALGEGPRGSQHDAHASFRQFRCEEVGLCGSGDSQSKRMSGGRLEIALERYERRDDIGAVRLDDERNGTLTEAQ